MDEVISSVTEASTAGHANVNLARKLRHIILRQLALLTVRLVVVAVLLKAVGRDVLHALGALPQFSGHRLLHDLPARGTLGGAFADRCDDVQSIFEQLLLLLMFFAFAEGHKSLKLKLGVPWVDASIVVILVDIADNVLQGPG